MKFRSDFVTNSSSSSFVCEICGRVESGWDMALSEAGMVECINGHVFCEEEVLEWPNRNDMIKAILEDEYNDYLEEELNSKDDESLHYYYSRSNEWGIPECTCPICQFIEYSEPDLSKYLLKKYNIPRDEVFAEVKQLNKRRKKLYENEYITYVCKKFDLNPTEIVAGWKEQFGTYAAFKQYLNRTL